MYKGILFPVALLCLASSAIGQTAQRPNAPPELRQLDAWVGKWSCEANTISANIKYAATMQCAWFAGGFALECRSQYSQPQVSSDVMIWGYSGVDKAYTMYSYNTTSVYRSVAKGQWTGTTWTYSRDVVYQGKSAVMRLEGKQESAERFSFQWRRSVEGGPWSTTMEGSCKKQ